MGVGTIIGGVGNYLYHLLMGRMLGPTDYGVLASLISFSYLLSIPVGTLSLVIVKFVSAFKGKKDVASIRALFRIGTTKILPFSFFILLIFLLLTPLITSFLHLPSFLPFLIVLGAFFVGIFSTINRAFLQGLLRFGYISLSSILEVGLKLAVAVGLVIWSFKVNGALFGLLVAGIFGYFFTFFPLRFLFQTNQRKLRLKGQEMFNFALPVFFSTLAFTSLSSSDVVLVRHFFPGEQSGFYGALSTLGKIILFLSGPIISVMFPLVSERHANGGNYKRLLFASIGLVGIICLVMTGIYFFVPSLVVRLFFGKAFLPIVSYLGLFGIFLSLYSLSFLFINFYLSIKKIKVVIMPVMAAVFQVIFIWFFHQTLWQVIWISLGILALLFVSLLVYYPQSEKI
jgi:O-antigen/teichoic acid export membrane protein